MAWGYPALLIGTMLEGETVLVLAGYAAHRGYLAFPVVVVVALLGSIVGDLLCFLLGRWRGPELLATRPSLHAPVERFRRIFERRGSYVIVILRFLYGLRIAGPFTIGMSSNISLLRFVALDTLGGLLWAPVVGGLGYAFGEVALRVLTRVERYEAVLLVGLLSAGLLWRFARAGRARRAALDGGG